MAGRARTPRLRGLRLGEIRALRWHNVNLDAGTISVERSLLPDGTAKALKTQAGARTVPMLPSLRREIIAWKVRSPRTKQTDPVIVTADGGHVQERKLRRALDDAKIAAGSDGLEERLS